MDLFVSKFTNKIDKKGRISLPSLFRNALPNNNRSEVILFKSLKHSSIEGCNSNRIDEKKTLGSIISNISDQNEK